MANEGTKFAQGENKIQIHTPLIDLTKAQIISKGIQLGVDYSMTHSCYDPSESGLSCGQCDACILRKAGFEAANITDPTSYQ
jgi:7-cyano-7-deazaguanine synthase